MQQSVRRIFVEKKPGFDVEAQNLWKDLTTNLGMAGLTGVRIIHRYDMEDISEAEYRAAREIIFAEPPLDVISDEVFPTPQDQRMLILQYLPGQYDQRADSAAQCMQILSQRERPEVKVAKLMLFAGKLSDEDFSRIKAYCLNPLEMRETTADKPRTLEVTLDYPEDVQTLAGFIIRSGEGLQQLREELGLAMSQEDLVFCQAYFRDTERRNPTLTEIRVLDTYWSDHCRHTTFSTRIESVTIEDGPYSSGIHDAYRKYLDSREVLAAGAPREMTLMNLATIAMKEFRKQGRLEDLEESDEINACSIVVPVDVDGRIEEWLVMFKNETHNHPTEIEPFGGAATCLGGAIRDPLSGRSYVYQAMRVTGSGDPTQAIETTWPGKLPQRKITTGAVAGFSAYGNQIGLATGLVAEIYDPDYRAKRMEIGAVIGAAPRKNVRRAQPAAGDIILLAGGRTGRDGCGGATGSSKEHTEESLQRCGAEVQKGNPPTERKIQRLFRNPAISPLIKKCNDFGAGGVAVAIGELADGLAIDLDAVPKKYEGLDGTELAISESQERMAVLLDPADVAAFCQAAALENLETSVVARVTSEPRLKMVWRGQVIVDLSRAFLNTNGVQQTVRVTVAAPKSHDCFFDSLKTTAKDIKQTWLSRLGTLNSCSQKGLVERFDSTIGAGTVFMPFGGSYQLTPIQAMAAKIPLLEGETTTGTMMAYGYQPELAKWSPFHGALYAIVEATAKIVASGGDYRRIRLTLQEYFEKLGQDPVRWGKPFAALLGAYYAQAKLGIPAIGGKDSMSGTFKEVSVPPTLVAFALAPVDVSRLISPEFKAVGSRVALIPVRRDQEQLPDFDRLSRNYQRMFQLIQAGKVLAAQAVVGGGVAESVTKMCFGNMIGFGFADQVARDTLFSPEYGAIILELDAGATLADLDGLDYQLLGITRSDRVIVAPGLVISLEEALQSWQAPLEGVFATRTVPSAPTEPLQEYRFATTGRNRAKTSYAKPRVFIPVFPGTNCEYDTGRAFEKAGAAVSTFVLRNLTPEDIEASIAILVKEIQAAQIVALPGGFSAGDEPDGSGKFIAAVFRNAKVKAAVMELLRDRDGLMLGICNGFQALIKLGLLPNGEIVDLKPDSPTLTYNTIGRHVSTLVRTKVVSKLSPWLAGVALGDVHTVAVSHGEGRFVADARHLEQLARNGQIATQYVDLAGAPSLEQPFNPNGSVAAIEGITSPDGRVLGKMSHSERHGVYLYQNVPGEKDQKIFQSGVAYFL